MAQWHVRFPLLLLAIPMEELLERLPLRWQLRQTARMDRRWERVGLEREPERLVVAYVVRPLPSDMRTLLPHMGRLPIFK